MHYQIAYEVRLYLQTRIELYLDLELDLDLLCDLSQRLRLVSKSNKEGRLVALVENSALCIARQCHPPLPWHVKQVYCKKNITLSLTLVPPTYLLF